MQAALNVDTSSGKTSDRTISLPEVNVSEDVTRRETRSVQNIKNGSESFVLGPVEQLLIEKTLLSLYPRLHLYAAPLVERFLGTLLPHALINSTPANTRRIVVIHCGDGLLCNILAMVFPQIEIVGIDPRAEKIATAKGTIGSRNNLTFIHGQPNLLPEIPCDRIIYNHSLLACKTSAAFKKLVLKTSQWLVEEGDWIIQESPWRIVESISLMKDMLPHFWGSGRYKTCLQDLLADVGYIKTAALEEEGFPGLAAKILLHANFNRNQASMLTFMNMAWTGSREDGSKATALQEAARDRDSRGEKEKVKITRSGCPLDDLFTDELHLPHHWELG